MKRRRFTICSIVLAILIGLSIMPANTVIREAVAQGQVKLDVLDPRGELYAPPVMSINPRLGTLAGKKIGILNNTKPGAEAFQPYLEKALKEAVPTVEIRTWVISYNAYPGKEKDLKALADWSDAVIGLLGD